MESWALVAIDSYHRFAHPEGVGAHDFTIERATEMEEALKGNRALFAWAVRCMAAVSFELGNGDKRFTRQIVERLVRYARPTPSEVEWVVKELGRYGIDVSVRLVSSWVPVVQEHVRSRETLAIKRQKSSGRPSGALAVDILFLTILPEEYEAVARQIRDIETIPPTTRRQNRNQWKRGVIPSASGNYDVVLGIIDAAGGTPAALALRTGVERYKPNYVILVGVAGGVKASLGDVVASSVIYGYEYGKIDENGYLPRGWSYSTDAALSNASKVLQGAGDGAWRKLISAPRPSTGRSKGEAPKVIVGPVGSGDKVIDNLDDPFVDALRAKWPDMVALEMEGVGAAKAIDDHRQNLYSVNFTMIRGICDVPAGGSASARRNAGATSSARNSAGTTVRDRWKVYASDVAASFAVGLVQSAWPIPPRGRS